MRAQPVVDRSPTHEVEAPAERPGPAGRFRPDRLAGAGIGLLFVIVTFVMAFPSIGKFTTATPGDYGDSFLYQYLVQWDVRAMFRGQGSLLDPTYFWPHHHTLLYSDTVLAVAPLNGLLAQLVGWPVAFNLIYVAGWVASLWATYGLARWCRASPPAAVLAGFVFTFAAVRLGHHGHFQLLFAFFIPLTLWVLLRFLAEPRWWYPPLIGLCGAAVFLNSGYIAVALFPSLVVVVVGWLAAARFRPGWKVYAGLPVAAAVTGVLIWPVLDGYQSLGRFLARDYNHEDAVVLKSFLAPATGSLLYGGLGRWADMPFEKRLFPGFVALGLAGLGTVALVRARRRRRGRAAPGSRRAEADLRRRGLVLVLVSTVPALLISFGRWTWVFGRKVTMPYSWIDGLPGFQTIRAFGRFTVVPLLAVALLAAVGFDRLVRGRRPVAVLTAAAVAGALMLVEYKAEVITSDRIDVARYAAVNRALADLPDAPVVELPMGKDLVWAFVEAPRMTLSAIDWKPRVNGYSGYPAPDYGRTVELMNSLDDGGPAKQEAMDEIDRLGVRYLVVRLAPPDETWDLPGQTYEDAGGAQAILRALPPERVVSVTREGEALLVRLSAPVPGRAPPASRP